jgi:hypothetical protein
MTTKIANTVEAHRAFWAHVARENGWYEEPFYVQVWRDMDGTITDSVSTRALTQDWEIEVKTFTCPACDEDKPYEQGHGDCRACDDCCECEWGDDGKIIYCHPY